MKKIIPLKPYNASCLFCTTRQEVLTGWTHKAHTKEDIADMKQFLEDCAGCAVYDISGKPYTYIIGVFDEKYGTLAHEMQHLVFYVAKRVNLIIDLDTPNEHITYLNGEVTEEAMQKVYEPAWRIKRIKPKTKKVVKKK